MAKRKTKFKPLIRCGCPVIGYDTKTAKDFGNCTCVLVSPKTSTRGRYLAPKGEYILQVTSHKHPLRGGVKPFKKI